MKLCTMPPAILSIQIQNSIGLYSIIFLVWAGQAVGQDNPTPFRYQSASHLGAGGAGVSSAKGTEALFLNPAGLSQGKGVLADIRLVSPYLSVGAGTQQIAKSLKDGAHALDVALNASGKPQHVGVQNVTAMSFRYVSLGVLQSLEVNAFVGDDQKTFLPMAQAHAQAVAGAYLGLSRPLIQDRFYFGMVFRYMQKATFGGQYDLLQAQKLDTQAFKDSQRRGWTVASDAGVLWVISPDNTKPTLGVVYRNIGQARYRALSSGNSPDPDRGVLDAGLSVFPQTKKTQTRLSVECRDITKSYESNIYKRLHAGAELSFQNVLGGQVGLSQGYPSYGAFLNLYFLRVDAGVTSVELGQKPGDRQAKRIFGQVSVGWTP